MLINLLGLACIFLAALCQRLGWPWGLAGSLLAAAALFGLNLALSWRLARDLQRLRDAFEPSQTHAANLDRKLTDAGALRAKASNAPFLFQTYVRDTGEVLSDLSMPIQLQGRRWGTLRVGFAPTSVMD